MLTAFQYCHSGMETTVWQTGIGSICLFLCQLVLTGVKPIGHYDGWGRYKVLKLVNMLQQCVCVFISDLSSTPPPHNEEADMMVNHPIDNA